MSRFLAALPLTVFLAACGGGSNPLNGNDVAAGTGDVVVTEPIPEGPVTGTENPTSNGSIIRYETKVASSGGGYATNVSYDADTQKLYIDNLPFDGDNNYTIDAQSPIGEYAGLPGVANSGYTLFEATPKLVDDSYDGGLDGPISQDNYKAIYGVSKNGGRTSFAIVRGGSYLGYGFGGFVYERNGSVVLPPEPTNPSQANYTGGYAGLRVFGAKSGIELVEGRVLIEIDFADFNNNKGGFRGLVSGRNAYTTDGALITALPDIIFGVDPDAIDASGEIRTSVSTNRFDPTTGAIVKNDTGTFYGILAGPLADELVGVIVVASEAGLLVDSSGPTPVFTQDPDWKGGAIQETGGMIVYR